MSTTMSPETAHARESAYVRAVRAGDEGAIRAARQDLRDGGWTAAEVAELYVSALGEMAADAD
jgi:hypothetical protein